jgi:hypothetical protein
MNLSTITPKAALSRRTPRRFALRVRGREAALERVRAAPLSHQPPPFRLFCQFFRLMALQPSAGNLRFGVDK